jgi:hypothetical protein
VASLLCLQAGPAWAEPSAADRTTARALAEEGYKALSKKDYALAEDRFRRADALVHAPSLVVDHARALVGLGRLADAYERYDSARREELPPRPPAAWKRAVADAQKEIKAIEAKIGWVTITVKGPVEPKVMIDEREVPIIALGSPFPTDPGDRTIRATADGFLPAEVAISLSAGQKKETSLELLPKPPEVVAEVAPPPKKVKPAPPPPQETKVNPLTYVAFGVGGAGLAVGAVTGILFLSEKSELDAACPAQDRCPPGTDTSSFYTYSYVSGISLLVGLAGAGTGVALLLTQPKQSDKEAEQKVEQKAEMVPYVGIGQVGVRGKF